MADGLLADRLKKALVESIIKARRKCNPHIGTRFLQLLNNYGPIECVKRLLQEDRLQSGLIQLWECKMLDLSVEAFILKPEFIGLFDQGTINRARERLNDLGYF